MRAASKKVFACVCLTAIAALGLADVTFKTPSFNAKIKLYDNRTATVDATIQLAIQAGSTGGISDLVLAEKSGAGSPRYAVARATVLIGQDQKPLATSVTDQGSLVTNLDAATLSNASTVQIHINYTAAGEFADRSGGTLGNRSTLTWNVIPSTWPTDIDSSSIEVEYPNGIPPLYVSATVNPGGSRTILEKRAGSEFTGSISRMKADENPNGAVFTPNDAIPAQSGFRLMVALPSENLKPAPARLTVPSQPAPPVSTPPKVSRPTTTAGVPPQTSAPQSHDLLLSLLPLLPPILFLLLYFNRFSWVPLKGYPTSAVPDGIGPAEAGYLVDGALTGQHLLGTLTQMADYGLVRLPAGGPLQISSSAQNGCGAFEKRLISTLSSPGTPADMQDLKRRLATRTQELEPTLVQSLSRQGVLSGGMRRAQLWTALSLLLAIVIADVAAIPAGGILGIVCAVIGFVLSILLFAFLRPITRKGLNTARKVAGLKAFIAANQDEFQGDFSGTGFRQLVPYAIAFGVVSGDS